MQSSKNCCLRNISLSNCSCVTSTRIISKKELNTCGNIVQERLRIIGVSKALPSKKNRCITCRRGGAQIMAPVMARLPAKKLEASAAFANVGLHHFETFTVEIGRRNDKR